MVLGNDSVWTDFCVYRGLSGKMYVNMGQVVKIVGHKAILNKENLELRANGVPVDKGKLKLNVLKENAIMEKCDLVTIDSVQYLEISWPVLHWKDSVTIVEKDFPKMGDSVVTKFWFPDYLYRDIDHGFRYAAIDQRRDAFFNKPFVAYNQLINEVGDSLWVDYDHGFYGKWQFKKRNMFRHYVKTANGGMVQIVRQNISAWVNGVKVPDDKIKLYKITSHLSYHTKEEAQVIRMTGSGIYGIGLNVKIKEKDVVRLEERDVTRRGDTLRVNFYHPVDSIGVYGRNDRFYNHGLGLDKRISEELAKQLP